MDVPASLGLDVSVSGLGPGALRLDAVDGWPTDPEQRKLEMRRRMAKHKQVSGHEVWRTDVKNSAQKHWDSMIPAQKAARQAKIQAGRVRDAKAALAELAARGQASA